MKRFCLAFLSICLLFSLSACGSKPFSDDIEAIELAAKSVVEINVYNKDDTVIASGSGFFVFDSKTIATNYHVIENAYKIEIIDDDDNVVEVSNIYNVDKDVDIAILQIPENGEAYTPLTISSSSDCKKGESVVAIGSPLGLKNTISKGAISNFVEQNSVEMIQFTAAISHGSSGGALLNDSGEVIGITTGSFVDGQSLNLAIPASKIVNLHDEKPLLKGVAEYYNDTVLPSIKPGVLTVGVCEWPPFAYFGPDNTLTGLEIDMLNVIAEDINLEIEYQVLEFEDLFCALSAKDVDCIAGGLMYSPERHQVANVTNPHFTDIDGSSIVMYVDKDNPKLQAALNDAIYKHQNDGVFDTILNEYGF